MSHPHGTNYGYSEHVRLGTPKCAPCTAAHARAYNVYVARRDQHDGPLMVPGIGTRRRLRALAAIGWTLVALGEHLGVTSAAVHQWTRHDLVQADTARRAAALYARLSDTDGSSDRTRAHAQRSGWAPPIAWDDDTIDDPDGQPYAGEHCPVDEVAVARAASQRTSERPILNRAEKRAAVRELTHRGDSAAEIAVVLGMTSRNVQAYRASERASA